MDEAAGLAPCPRCGKPEGKMRDIGRGRFRFYVVCGSCAFMTDPARTEGIALKLWSEAKPASPPKRRTKKPPNRSRVTA
jgi:hypothetical protein